MNPNRFTEHSGAKYPLICGAMYPCSNPELVAAASEAGALGVVQPLSFVYAHERPLREALRFIRARTSNPIGFNALVEKSSKVYEKRMHQWVDIALEEGVRFFITALGNPSWVVEKVHAVAGIVYHDVTDRRWADKALSYGVDGLICVNSRAGGHAGNQTPQELFHDLQGLKVPLVCAGGISDAAGVKGALDLGYAAVQLGTRFIASQECTAHDDYKAAIVAAQEEDIVLTQRLTGVPVAVINTPSVKKMGVEAGPLARFLLGGQRTKHWVRLYYSLQALWKLKRASRRGLSYKDYFQAGRSVAKIDSVLPVSRIVQDLINFSESSK